jgi:hypothetical protein
MAIKKAIEDLEIGDLVILPSDDDREWRSVVTTEADKVPGQKKCGHHITVRGIIEPYVGYEGEEIPYQEATSE